MHDDVVVLTDSRWVTLDEQDWYSRQVHHEDGLVVDALRRCGLTVSRRAWDDASVDWHDAGALLFRTTWDYFDRFGEFSPWLDQVSSETTLYNEAGLLRWNIDKHYLADLREARINIVPTCYLEINEPRTLVQAVSDTGWDELILKPAVSGSARHTYRFAASDAARYECVYAELIQQEALMLQPFQHQIVDHGELSLMVIDGQVTHAIRKTAKTGDFRVQDDHGGTVHRYAASAEEITFAEAAVAAVPFDVLYARVDVIRDNDGRLAIMELEMIEPELFFRFNPAAADRLAAGLQRRMNER
ncbi:hypothetical protein QU481_20830 [Crenobacter sp. SG2303]|uniref:ATP-grasp fold RimK-type domain-containing protein n=1 Tax=Crenobacter oryzisoli TaxID=3056844 RepID=A0ABT7XU05_9NEIS|nr:hypothetical protein [Crenobacter sp. SG2303]MDN0077282.1 hypothetical protein [Crenobacter sp. SG2303]